MPTQTIAAAIMPGSRVRISSVERVSPAVVDQVEVAEDPVEDRRRGGQHLGADERGVDGVDRVADDRRGGDHRDHLVEERQRVVLEHRPGLPRAGVVFFLHRLLTALGEAEEEREHPGADQEPLGGLGVDGDGAGDDAQDEEAGDRHHVDDHEALQHERVGGGRDAVAGDQGGDLGRDDEPDRDRTRGERDPRRPSRPAGLSSPAAIGRRRFSWWRRSCSTSRRSFSR